MDLECSLRSPFDSSIYLDGAIIRESIGGEPYATADGTQTVVDGFTLDEG